MIKKNWCNSLAMNLGLAGKLMTSVELKKYLVSNFPNPSLNSLVEKEASFLPFHTQLDVILQTNFSIIIAHCFIVIYSEGTY